ncbi:hypothetical protein HK405_001830 [Cladochytrium tenue]|nr:hypothetical protein HK405_001830 [Cladochytrium tenue]
MGIPVFTAPFQHQNAIAELCISFIVLLARKIGDRSKEIHSGEWNKVSANCYEVRGKTLGIVGYAHLGGQLGVMAEAMGMRVVFWDEQAVMPIGRAESKPSVDAVLASSDFLVLNVEAAPENVGLIGKKELALMKKGSYLINPSFGDASDFEVDIPALADALTSGHLEGAAIDAEPSGGAAPGDALAPLQGLKNVILTPSLSLHNTRESEIRIAHEVATLVAHYLQRGSTIGASNFPSIASSWPLSENTRRICNVHRNVRGVLREIDLVVGNYNVGKQVLDTKDGIGYLVVDVQTDDVATEVVSQLATAVSYSPSDLSQAAGIPQAAAAAVIKSACSVLFPIGLRNTPVAPGRKQRVQGATALSLLRAAPRFVTTGDSGLDATLGGGVPVGCITELFGESGAGKTQLALQLCLTVQWREDQGGLAGGAVYIATEQWSPVGRLAEMASVMLGEGRLPAVVDDQAATGDAEGVDVSTYLNNIHLIHLRDAETQHHIIKYQLPIFMEKNNVRLVVVDSIAANFRGGAQFDPSESRCLESGNAEGSSTNQEARFEQSRAILQLGQSLKKTADMFSAAIVCVNQVSAAIRDQGGSGSHPALTFLSASPAVAYTPSSVIAETGGLPSSNYAGIGRDLLRISEQLDPSVLAADSTAGVYGFSGTSGIVPTLGIAWTNAVTLRLKLRKLQRRLSHNDPQQTSGGHVRRLSPLIRVLTVYFAPHIPSRTCEAVVLERGVVSLESLGFSHA